MEKQTRYFLSVKDFSERSGLPTRTLYRKINEGKIVSINKSDKVLIHYTQLPSEKAQRSFLEDGGLLKTEDENPDAAPKYPDLKPWQRRKADQKEAIVKEFLMAAEEVTRGNQRTFKRRFARAHKIAARTLERWISDYRSGGYEALIPNWNPGTQKKLIDREIAKYIEDEFLKPLGPPLKMVHEKLVEKFSGKRERLPQYRTVVCFINSKWTKSQQLLIRNKELWDRRYSPHVRRDWDQVELNEVWVGDAKQIDVACMFRGKPIFPWFTAFIDAKSRKFVGWILTQTPDSWAIAQAFVYAVSQHGVPGTIYIDRGKPYKSHMIAGTKIKPAWKINLFGDIENTHIPGIFKEVGSDIFFAAPYNAREKIIEPNFKIFTFRMTNLPGYRGHSTKTRPKKLEKEIKNGELLSFEKLSQKVDELIESRNNRPHSTTQKTPNSFYEKHTPIVPSKELLAYLLMDSHFKKAKDSTVTIEGMTYRHDELWRVAGDTVEVRRDPKDLRKAAIIYQGKFFGFASLETPSHYRSPITLESVKEAAKIRKKTRAFRKKVIENNDYIEDPLTMAIDLEEKQTLKARDIRPAMTNVTRLHPKEKVARDLSKGLQNIDDEQTEPEEEKEAVNEGPVQKYLRHLRLCKTEEEEPSIWGMIPLSYKEPE